MMLDWLFKPRNPIEALRQYNKDEWCKRYFPEYAALFGGYPKSIPVKFCNPGETTKFSGQTRPIELAPWEYFDGEDGSIDEFGNKWSVQHGENGAVVMSKTPATDAEYLDWCDSRNYFRSGDGLNPEVFVGAADYRGTQWNSDLSKYRVSLLDSKSKIYTKPDKITCPTGIYFPERGPSSKNPFGVNSSFHPNGSKEPSYVGDHYGPDARPSTSQLAGGPVTVWWDETLNGPRPSQSDYDKARYSSWL